MFQSYCWNGLQDIITITDDEFGYIDHRIENSSILASGSIIIIPYVLNLEYSKRNADVAMQIALYEDWVARKQLHNFLASGKVHTKQDAVLPQYISNWKEIASKRDKYLQTIRLMS